jgi:hypothetical protein
MGVGCKNLIQLRFTQGTKLKSAQLVVCSKMMAHHAEEEQDNLMGWFILTQLFSILIQLIRIGRMSPGKRPGSPHPALPIGYGRTKSARQPARTRSQWLPRLATFDDPLQATAPGLGFLYRGSPLVADVVRAVASKSAPGGFSWPGSPLTRMVSGWLNKPGNTSGLLNKVTSNLVF